MTAIVVRKFGGPEVLVPEDLPVPQPGPGQVLVRIAAAGVNPADTYARSGAPRPGGTALPYTPGTDGAGTVEALGPGVGSVAVGDRVFLGRSVTGTYAEMALALESQVYPLPDRLTFAQGAGVYVPYATAFHSLVQRAAVRPGETVLVHGASGGVGVASTQWCRRLGVEVWGTAGTDPGRELVLAQGAGRVFDHRTEGYRDQILEATGDRGVDVILEMAAHVNLGHDLKLVAPGGRIVVIGSRGDVTVTPRDLMSRRAEVLGVMLWQITEAEAAEIRKELAKGLADGGLSPVVGRELPLAQASEAHRLVLEPGAYGKIVLFPGQR
ncbi:MAG TPA: NADPH:quinone reductase [Spirochaetia bacterium]|nr:NADPH:quinone reductase [Spirochaetia bacterium]